MTEPGTVIRLLDPSEVADILGVPVASLNNMRYRGRGPNYVKLGHRTVKYRPTDVSEWVERHLVNLQAKG